VVAGDRERGHADGALNACQFRSPIGLCRYGDSLFVADFENRTIRVVEGVLGVADPLTNSKLTGAEYEARLIMTAIPALPKELAQLMAQYMHVIGRTRTIVGIQGTDTASLRPGAIAVDNTDPLAGPQLIIGDGVAVRCLNLRTEMVTTIAGGDETGRADGPASRARFDSLYDFAVGSNGAIFVADRCSRAVRRISAAKWQWPASASGAMAAPAAERMVTTLIGEAGPDVQFARSSAESFRTNDLPHPRWLCTCLQRQGQGQGQGTPTAMSGACTSVVRSGCTPSI
jgi:hypothetical protein